MVVLTNSTLNSLLVLLNTVSYLGMNKRTPDDVNKHIISKQHQTEQLSTHNLLANK